MSELVGWEHEYFDDENGHVHCWLVTCIPWDEYKAGRNFKHVVSVELVHKQDPKSLEGFMNAAANQIRERDELIAALKDGLDVKENMIARRDLLLQRLLNKVNKVTAYHRHGNEVPENYLTELSNRQIDVERVLKIYMGKDGPTHVTVGNVLADIMDPEELADSLSKANDKIVKLRGALEVVVLIEEVLRDQNSTLDDIHQYTNQIDEACDVYKECK